MSINIYVRVPMDEPYDQELFSTNITHNLTGMWRAAGFYDELYNSEGKTCAEVVEAIQNGYQDMRDHPEKYRQYSAKNGWGTYEQALPWLEKLIREFERYPKGRIHISK